MAKTNRACLAREFASRYGHSVSAVPKGFGVYSPFARRTLRQRIVALAAAYAIALGGLFASLAGANAEAAAAIGSGPTICHSHAGAASSPGQSNQTDCVCTCACCVGCLMLMAALPPPPLKTIGAPQSAAQRLALPSAVAKPPGTSTTSHQSRAPPRQA